MKSQKSLPIGLLQKLQQLLNKRLLEVRNQDKKKEQLSFTDYFLKVSPRLEVTPSQWLSPANKRPGICGWQQNSSGNSSQQEGLVDGAYYSSTVCVLLHWTSRREGWSLLRTLDTCGDPLADLLCPYFTNTHHCLLWLGTGLGDENSIMKKTDFVLMKPNQQHDNIIFPTIV